MTTFPKDFFWGAATSSHQVEGDNRNNDWWEWEGQSPKREKSLFACRHYELYPQDFAIAKSLNHNCHRISLEWSRIEPQEGKFDPAEISHYRDVILNLRKLGLEPMVTLHHFTNPLWLIRRGGWHRRGAEKFFLRYVKNIVPALSDQVRFWITINEPLVYAYWSYLVGTWPPQKKSLLLWQLVAEHLTRAHIQAYHAIHEHYSQKKLPAPQVSIAHNMRAFVPCQDSFNNRLACWLRNKHFNFAILDTLVRKRSLDFIGVNYYSRDLIDLAPGDFFGITLSTCKKGHDTLLKNSLGWEIYPQGLHDLLMRLKDYNLPVIITENGVCTDDDALRWDFIRGHLMALAAARQKGAPVAGYIYWSLMDNFEWDKGFGHRFGLVEIDYSNYQRRIRESAKKFAEVCKSCTLE